MNRKSILWLVASAVVMLLIPGLAAGFAPHDTVMALCFLLFFAVDPIYALLLGVFSGLDIRRMWYQPVLASVLYVAGTWLFLEWGEQAFLMYAGGYLVIGLSFMLVSAGFTALNNRNRQERL